MLPSPTPSLNTHRNFRAVFGGVLRSFSPYCHIPTSSMLIWLFLYQKREREEVSRSHFSFSLDELNHQSWSWEISCGNKKKKKSSKNSECFLGSYPCYFSFPTAWQKTYLSFRVSQNCAFLPWLLVWFAGCRAREDMEWSWGWTMSHSRTLPSMLLQTWGWTSCGTGNSFVPQPRASFLLCCPKE